MYQDIQEYVSKVAREADIFGTTDFEIEVSEKKWSNFKVPAMFFLLKLILKFRLYL